MKRFILTALTGPNDKPLFDLVIYGVDLSEAMAHEDQTTERIEARLRERNLTIGDFSGFRMRTPPDVPRGSTTVEYLEQPRGRR